MANGQTDNPHAMVAADPDNLRSLGWRDIDIFDAVEHASRMVGTDIIFRTFNIDRD